MRNLITLALMLFSVLYCQAQDKAKIEKLLEFVKVKGGTFTMGDSALEDAKPHKVKLRSFYMQKTEVTQELWEAVMGSNPSYFNVCPNCPVEEVSWDDIQQFISKLNAKTGKTYRLPTEAEWEFAARGGKKSKGYKYAGSNEIEAVAWYDGNSGYKTHPVGQKSPNELGIYDMSGNVWEWCSDWYGESYYNSSPGKNPQGPASGRRRVLRGGGWDYNPQLCRVSNRSYNYPGRRNDNVGFRLVLVPSSK
jgi:formylglycine-generating enzyme required for sulfatase activity